jgi:hypothetical protein
VSVLAAVTASRNEQWPSVDDTTSLRTSTLIVAAHAEDAPANDARTAMIPVR